MTALVSIIIPTYNRAHLIGETLDSILAQTYTNWECIVVDDGSTDGTEALMQVYIEKDNRFQYHHRPSDRPKGANACRNFGFEVSKGELILFLDSDDFLSYTCLNNRVAYLSNNVDFLVSKTQPFTVAPDIIANEDIKYTDYSSLVYLKKFLAYRLPWTIMSVLWKRKTIVGYKFDEKLSRLQDVHFHISVLVGKYNLRLIDCVDSHYRHNNKKKESSEHLQQVVSSFTELFSEYIIPSFSGQYNKELRRFAYYFLLKFIIPNTPNFKREYHQTMKILKLILKIPYSEELLLITQFWLHKIGISMIKGIGIYRFSKWTDNKLLATDDF